MYDHEILADLLSKMQDCLNKIQLRFQFIDDASDLIDLIISDLKAGQNS